MAPFALAGLLFVSGAGLDGLGQRVDEILARRALGAEALGVIDNLLRGDGARPVRAAPPLVAELLAQPLQALDAAAIFRRSVPAALASLADGAKDEAPTPFRELLLNYVDELAAAQSALREATGRAAIDEQRILAQLEQGLLSADSQLAVAAAVDDEALARANERFIAATGRFVRGLRAVRDFPEKEMEMETAIGRVVIGSRGNDRHPPGAALILDPGGDDVYEPAPVTRGPVSVSIDLGRHERSEGSDVVVRGFSALVDLAGDDVYEMRGPGLGAAIAGASVLLDDAGDDVYRLPFFGQGAAGFGIGALIDRAGNDRYEIRAWGQGLGVPGGLGLLWDLAGDDRYYAAGIADAYDRGAGLSGAQGAAMGLRTMLAGGIGILRDDSGDDAYAAEMFAQGEGYFYGLGLLWERGGNDRYVAARYAQGTGVHQAVGVLRDEGGDDHYVLTVGVGQGMGLDLAVGVLADLSGDDRYSAGLLAQGTGTANGVGILADGGGADRWQVASGDRQWGQAEWLRDLPTVGLFLYEPERASFAANGGPIAGPPEPRKVAEAEPPASCPPEGTVDPAEIASVRRDHFDALYFLGARVACARQRKDGAEGLWPAL